MPHCEKIKSLGYPTELRPFLKSCGNSANPVNPEQFNKDMLKKVNVVIKEIAAKLDNSALGIKSATDAQGKYKLNIQ